jgi:succinate dehydrogenase hydrophobic anchor subunit
MAHVLAHAAQAALATRGISGNHAAAHAAGLAQAEPIPGLGGRTAFFLIAAVVVAIAAVAVLPLIMDVRRATAWRQQLTDRLIDQAGSDQDVRDFLRDLREPRGVRGLTRSIIAILILALVGFALAVAMLSSGTDSGDLRKTIVTSLMTVLATVAGFYFGSLGAQNSAEDARRHPAAKNSATVVAGPAGSPDVSRTEGVPAGPAGHDAAAGSAAAAAEPNGPAAASAPAPEPREGGADTGTGTDTSPPADR